jgi:hypothetical protein
MTVTLMERLVNSCGRFVRLKAYFSIMWSSLERGLAYGSLTPRYSEGPVYKSSISCGGECYHSGL